jgi:hypothetical protein
LSEGSARRSQFDSAAGEHACSGAGNGRPQKMPTGEARRLFVVTQSSAQ